MLKNGMESLRGKKFFGLDFDYTIKNSLFLSVAKIIAAALSLFLAIFLANIFTPEEFGNYKYILIFVTFCTAFSLPGINLSVLRSVSRGFDGSYLKGIRFRILFGTFGCIISLGAAIYYFYTNNFLLGISFLTIAPLIPFIDSLNIYTSLLNAKGRFKVLSLNSITFTLITGLITGLTAWITQNILYTVLSVVISTVILRGIYTLQSLSLLENKEQESGSIKYGLHLSFFKFLSTASGSLQQILLFQFLGPVQLAIYAMAIAPTEQLRGNLSTIESIIFPKISKDSWRLFGFVTFIRKILNLLLILTSICLVYNFIAETLFEILLPAYVESVPYTQIYIWTIIPTLVYSLLLSIVRAKKLLWELNFLSVVGIILEPVLVIGGMLYFDLWGVIFGIIVSKCIILSLAIILLFFVKRQ